MPRSSHPTSIRLPDELKRDLKTIAEFHRWELARTIVLALQEWVLMQKKVIRRARKPL